QSRHVIIDLTGVEMIDTRTADHFLKLIKAVALLGAQCRITGIRPAVAQTLVDLGVNLGGVRASRTLKHALRDLLQGATFTVARGIPGMRARRGAPRAAPRSLPAAPADGPPAGSGQERSFRKETSS
ncbi:MAG TPA: STAS domain-containing protein, partial [Candidatus Nanopelagicales bacterium]|nr:STAS domain-containing protein [Candidatus Nanopelagicales bacterium]